MANVIESNMQTTTWWHGLRDDVCVLQFDEHACLAETSTTFVGVEYTPDHAEVLCFDLVPPRVQYTGKTPEMVRLIVLSDTASTVFHLGVVQFTGMQVRVLAQPLSIQRRYLRRAPRIPYNLGPYPAVVHAADKVFRGVLELWLRDVSPYGVGFKTELGRAYVLCVGDVVRCPIVLPDGQRTWIEGTVTWLDPDGSGGIATRKTPAWLPASPELLAAPA